MRCPSCGLDRPLDDFKTRKGEHARRFHREGQHYGRCTECRRVEKSSPRQYLNKLIVKAKVRRRDGGLKVITPDHMMSVLHRQGGRCPLTGLQITFSTGSGVVFTNASLDRIDPSKGYIQGNVRVVTLWANLARNVMSDEDFLFFCNLVSTHHKAGQTQTGTPNGEEV